MILLRLLGYLWSLPCLVVGLVLLPFYRPKASYWSEGCWELVAGTDAKGRTRIFGRPGAQTHGWLIYYASEEKRRSPRLRAHERVHVRQAAWGGVFFSIAYALQFLWLFARPPAEPAASPRWYRAYYALWFERQARERSCHLPKESTS